MATLTSANAVFVLGITGLFSSAQQLQGFDTDDIFSTESVSPAQTKMGVDGILSAGWVPQEKKMMVALQADSPSIEIFDIWNETQNAAKELFPAFGLISIPGLGRKYTLIKGYLTGYPPIPDAKLLMQARRFQITWQDTLGGADLMARKTKDVPITAEGRDKGKTFHLTEMSAAAAEKWAARALSALLRSGVHVPDEVLSRGLAGIAMVGLRGLMGLSFADAEPLMDELFGCVQRKEALATRPLVDDDIEEVLTRLQLRSEVIELHVGFSIAAYLSKQWADSRTETDENTSGTPT